MPIDQESAAVALARALAEAWSHHDWDKARAMLAPDVHVTVTTTQPPHESHGHHQHRRLRGWPDQVC
jgi:ketosteroid isomerase-like protein